MGTFYSSERQFTVNYHNYGGLFSRGVYYANFVKWKFPQRLHPWSHYTRYVHGCGFPLFSWKLIPRIAAILKFAKYTPLENIQYITTVHTGYLCLLPAATKSSMSITESCVLSRFTVSIQNGVRESVPVSWMRINNSVLSYQYTHRHHQQRCVLHTL